MPQKRVKVPALQIPGAANQKLTNEEKQEQFLRMVMQKKESYTMGIVYNLVHGLGPLSEDQGAQIIRSAASMADLLLKELYGVVKAEGQEAK